MAKGKRHREWLELFSELMSAPLARMPDEHIALMLCETFDSVACSYSEFSRGTLTGGGLWPSGETFGGRRAEMIEWIQKSPQEHPLLRFFESTQRCLPMQISDVPVGIVGEQTLAAWQGVGRSVGCPDQLSLPLSVSGGQHRAFVLGRDGAYVTEELEFATLLWRMLLGLDRQIGAFSSAAGICVPPRGRGRVTFELTSRESAVLLLLSDGHTAATIARKLTISTRTAEKHLQHVYSKLAVGDRLQAVLRARELGLVPDPTTRQSVDNL